MGEKSAGVGSFIAPTQPAAAVTVVPGAANTYGSWTEIVTSTAAAVYINRILFVNQTNGHSAVQIGTGGAGSETVVGEFSGWRSAGSIVVPVNIIPFIPVAASTRIAVRTTNTTGGGSDVVAIGLINQSNVVDDGVAGTSSDSSGVTTLLSRIPGTVQAQTGDSYARLGAPTGASIAADIQEVEGETDTLLAGVLITPGTAAGQLDVTSGVIKANLAQILGTALTETAGLLAGGFKKFFNISSPVHTIASIDQTGDSYARLGAPAGASIAADLAEIEGETDGIASIPTGDAYARLGAPVGASISADIAEIEAETDTLLAGVNVTQWNSHAIPAENVNGYPLVDIKYVNGLGIPIDSGTATAIDATHITLRAGAPAVSLVGCLVLVDSSTTGQGQVGFCTAYNTGTKQMTINGWSQQITPTGTITYVVFFPLG